MTAKKIFHAICLNISNPPKACQTPEIIEEKEGTRSSTIYIAIIIITVISIIIFMICMCYCQRIKKTKFSTEMALQINTMVSNYLTIRDTEQESKLKVVE